MSGTEVTGAAVNFRNQHGARKANPSLPSSTRSWVRKTGTRCNKPLGRGVDLGRAGGGRVDVTKVLKAPTQEGWGKEGYQPPGRSRLKQAAVAIGSREIVEGTHGKLEIREAPWDDQSPTDEPANYCHPGEEC